MANKNSGADVFKQILSLQASDPTATVSAEVGMAARPSRRSLRVAKAALPAALTAALVFGATALALATQPKLRHWLTVLWDGDAEARRLKKRIAKAQSAVTKSIAKCHGDVKELAANLEKLEADLQRWVRGAEARARAAAAQAEAEAAGDHQKNSGYYHFASTGTKYVNKWDSFDVEEEIKKIDGGEGAAGNDDEEEEEEEEDKTGTRKASSAQRSSSAAPKIDDLTKRAREFAVAAKTLLDKRLDGITHEMANNPDVFSDCTKLRKKRQKLCKRLNDVLVPRSQALVKAIREERRKQQELEKSLPAASSSSSQVDTSKLKSALEAVGDAGAVVSPSEATTKSVAGSAWNKDNRQYEEKSVKDWAESALVGLLQRVAIPVTLKSSTVGIDAEPVRVRVTSCKVTGMAAVTATSRGPGCVFSFDKVDCDWTSDDGRCNGSLTISDVDVTDVSAGEMEEPLTVQNVAVSSGPPALGPKIRSAAAGLLKPCFRSLLDAMQQEFVHANVDGADADAAAGQTEAADASSD